MKKIALLGVLALAMGFTACDNYEEPNPPAQSNPQEPVLAANGLSYAIASQAEGTIDLPVLNNSMTPVVLANVTLAEPLAEGYALKNVVEIGADDTFAKVDDVAATTIANEDGTYTVTVAPDALQAAMIEVTGKSPAAKNVFARFAAFAVNGDSEYRIGDPSLYYGPIAINVLPIPQSYVIEDNYYLIGTASDGSVANALKFNHSALSPYDDPEFKLAVNITNDQAEDGWQWMIISETAFAAKDINVAQNCRFGVEEGDEEVTEGTLFGNNDDTDPVYGIVTEAGPHMFTINMLEMTFSINLAIENLWTPGNSNGWNQGNSQMLFTEDYVHYHGYAHLNGEFKFTSQPDWGGINFGAAGEGELSTDGGAGNLNAPADGLYWCDVNIIDLTYTITPINSLGVIGNLNGWGAQEALTPSEDFLTWTGKVNFDGGEWKFRANDDWGINLGGSLSELTPGGANITSPAGEHTVTLYLGQLPYTATVE